MTLVLPFARFVGAAALSPSHLVLPPLVSASRRRRKSNEINDALQRARGLLLRGAARTTVECHAPLCGFFTDSVADERAR